MESDHYCINNGRIVKAVLFISILLLITSDLFSQDPQFSQFYANPIYLNPALVGVHQEYRATLNYRQQWGNATGYTTSAFSMDGRLGSNSGVGIQVMHDKQFNDVLVSSFYNASVSHRISLTETSQLGMGIGFGYYHKNFNWQNLVFEDQLNARYGVMYDTKERFDYNAVSNMDFSTGLIYTSNNIVGGVSIDHLNRPNEEFVEGSSTRVPLKYTLHLAGNLENKNFWRRFSYLSPNIIYERQGDFEYWNLGMFYANSSWVIGGWYRVKEALIVSMGMNIDKFRLGYSYDYTIAPYRKVVGNTHELSLSYQFDIAWPKKPKDRYKGKCPDFYKYLF